MQRHIQWFPGHMAKAYRSIKEHLKLVDVVVELLDARIPYSSSNPVIDELISSKPRIIVLNKCDLADEKFTQQWVKFYKDKGFTAIPVDALTGKGCRQLTLSLENAASPKIKALAAKGIINRPVRAMILGIPNVGKSSLINRLLGTATVKTGDKPGVTRGKQWIKISKNLELLDTPGVLWPKLDNQKIALRLAMTGAINDEVYDYEYVSLCLVDFLRLNYAQGLAERYKLNLPIPENNEEVLQTIGKKRGCLQAGGIVDLEKARRILFTEFRGGKLGPITLDIKFTNEELTDELLDINNNDTESQ